MHTLNTWLKHWVGFHFFFHLLPIGEEADSEVDNQQGGDGQADEDQGVETNNDNEADVSDSLVHWDEDQDGQHKAWMDVADSKEQAGSSYDF